MDRLPQSPRLLKSGIDERVIICGAATQDGLISRDRIREIVKDTLRDLRKNIDWCRFEDLACRQCFEELLHLLVPPEELCLVTGT